MGFFSWKTADTKRPINNVYSKRPHKRTVYLLQPDSKPSIAENDYEGYGNFGGVDAYAWLARMNLGIDGPDDEIRGAGISLQFKNDPSGADMTHIKYPLKFSFSKHAVYEDLPASEADPNQGYFL